MHGADHLRELRPGKMRDRKESQSRRDIEQSEQALRELPDDREHDRFLAYCRALDSYHFLRNYEECFRLIADAKEYYERIGKDPKKIEERFVQRYLSHNNQDKK